MTSISRNLYIDKLADTINKENNTYHSTNEMKSVDVIQAGISILKKKIIKNDIKLKY